jgi:RHH-type rel operon transcriptional repressor/antitoxin RelB
VVNVVRLRKSIRLEKDLEARLERLARLTGRSKSYYVNQALADQLQKLEDRFDARRPAWGDGSERILPLYELECALRADDFPPV